MKRGRKNGPCYVATLAATCVAVCAGTVRAEEPRAAAVSWVRLPGAEGCTSAGALARAIDARLGRPAIALPTRAELFVEGRIEPGPEGSGFRVAFVMTDAAGALVGTREIESDEVDCRALDESIALVASLMIDPDAPLRAEATPVAAPEPAPAPEPQVETATVLPAPPPEPCDCEDNAAREAAAATPWRLGLSADGVLALGLLPGVAIGAGLRIEVVPPGFVPLEIAAAFFPQTRDQLRDGAGADLLAAWGEVGICPVSPLDGIVRVLACTAIEVGTIQSRGFGFDLSLDDEALLVAASARVRMSARVAGPLVLALSVGAAVPFERPRFYALDGDGAERELFRVAPVLGVFELSLGGDFS